MIDNFLCIKSFMYTGILYILNYVSKYHIVICIVFIVDEESYRTLTLILANDNFKTTIQQTCNPLNAKLYYIFY